MVDQGVNGRADEAAARRWTRPKRGSFAQGAHLALEQGVALGRGKVERLGDAVGVSSVEARRPFAAQPLIHEREIELQQAREIARCEIALCQHGGEIAPKRGTIHCRSSSYACPMLSMVSVTSASLSIPSVALPDQRAQQGLLLAWRTTLSTLILYSETRHRLNCFNGTPHISIGSYSQGSMTTAFILRLVSTTAAFGGVRRRSGIPRIGRDRGHCAPRLATWGEWLQLW